MPKKKTYHPSRHFSFSIVVIGASSLIGAIMYSHALEQVRLTANAADYSCHGSLQICMKSAEKLEDCAACSKDNGNSVKTASCQACTAHKGICQNTYNGCSGHGDNIHPW